MINLKMPILIISIALVFLLSVTVSTQTVQDSKRDVTSDMKFSVSFCNLDLAEKWKLGNLTFNSLYSFRVKANGGITQLKKIRDEFIGYENVAKCTSNWNFQGFPEGSQFVVYFNWKHGKGWVEQQISGQGITSILRSDKGIIK